MHAQLPLLKELKFDGPVHDIVFHGRGSYNNFSVIYSDRAIGSKDSVQQDTSAPVRLAQDLNYMLSDGNEVKKTFAPADGVPALMNGKFVYTIRNEGDTVALLRKFSVAENKVSREVRSYLPGKRSTMTLLSGARKTYFLHKYNYTGSADKTGRQMLVYSDALQRVYTYKYIYVGEAELSVCGLDTIMICEFDFEKQRVHIEALSLSGRKLFSRELTLPAGGPRMTSVSMLPSRSGILLICKSGRERKSQLFLIDFKGREAWRAGFESYVWPGGYWPAKKMFFVSDDYECISISEKTGQVTARHKFDSSPELTRSGNFACFTASAGDPGNYSFSLNVSDNRIVRAMALPVTTAEPEIVVRALHEDVIAVIIANHVLVYDLSRW